MKKLLLFIFGTMLAFAANGQSNLPPCRGSDAMKWSNCFGTYTWAGGEKYAGEWKDGKRRGEGINTLANGRVQEGFWIDDKFVKPEKINLPSQQADPPLNENRPRLEAVQNTQSKLPPCPKIDYSIKTDIERFAKWHNCWGRYKWEFLDGFIGDVHEGEWRNGYPNGQGTYYYLANGQFKGDKYVGEYKDGKYHGEGTYTFANGNKHVGQHKDGKANGQGTRTLADGTKYVGEWEDGKPNGQGTYTYANGDKYVGDHKDGQRNGQGTYTFADGRVQEGIWAEDKFVRAEKINLPNQQTDLALNEDRRRLEAELRSQQSAQETQGNLPPCPPSNEVSRHMCFGTYTSTNGNKYVGEWKDNKYHGRGTYTYANGDKYVGEFEDNKYHGQGTYTIADGRVQKGTWADNEFVRVEKIVTPSELAEQKQKLDSGRRGQFERIPKPPPVEAKRKNKNTEFARMKCIDFGFKAGTPAYADCVKEYLKSSGNTLPNTKE